MKITVLVENTSACELEATHGLSLYIETKKHKLLFDLGPDQTVFENAKKRGIDLQEVDTIIISHGHNDHGGALKQFLEENDKARIYIQERAFEPHFSKSGNTMVPIGLNPDLKGNPRMVLLNGDYVIDEELQLFMVDCREKCYSEANDVLCNAEGVDEFSHEQNLIIRENETVLIMGCGHTGVINIMERAKQFYPKVCIGGFHLYRPRLKQSVSEELLEKISVEMKHYSEVQFYTCHCTGEKAYRYLADRMENVHYISCGEYMQW